ncbi:MAG: hypothetical protein ACREV0_09115 [Burkholderiales bacterium]
MLNIVATDAASARIEAALDQANRRRAPLAKKNARDQYRHPKETLLFGLRPDLIGEKRPHDAQVRQPK